MPVVIGGGSSLQTVHVAPAIRYAVDNGADVINMSFGISGDVPEVRAAVEYAASKGVLMVAAAGNSGGLDRDVTPTWPVSYRVPELIGVGSSNAADAVARHSDVGPTSVHLFAPGEELVAAYPGGRYALSSGTSFASPTTAAAAALVLAARPGLTAVAVKDLLLRTVEPLPGMAGRSVSGGRLDAGRALATLAAPARVSVHGLDRLRAKAAGTATVRVAGSGRDLPAGGLAMQVFVAAYREGRVLAVADLPVDGGAAGAGRTGRDGSLLLTPPGLTATALASGVDVPLTLTLPEGRYGLVAQLVSSSGEPVTPPQAVSFAVAAHRDGSAGPGDDGRSGPVAGTSPGTSGGGTSGGGTSGGGTSGGGRPGADAPGGGDGPVNGEVPGVAGAPEGGGSGGTSGGGGEGQDGVPRVEGGAPAGPGSNSDGRDSGGTDSGARPGPGSAGPGSAGGGTGSGGTGSGGTGSGGTGGGPPDCGLRRFPPTTHFAVTALDPSCGGLGGSDVVTLSGTRLPKGASVLIGGQPARVLFDGAPTSLTVVTPLRYNAGDFDVAVYSPARVVDVLPAAFTYYDEDASGGADRGSTAPGDGSTPGGAPPGPTGGSGPGGAAGGPTGDPADFEGLTLVDTGGNVGGLTAAALALLDDCGESCFAAEL